MMTLPEPLTPADCDLRDFPFMPLDVVRLRDSDLAVTADADEFRCAVLLWCAAWHQVPAASLPDDDKALAQYAGYGRVVKEWQKVRAGALRGWIKCSDDRLYHPVVAEKANDAWLAKLKQRLKTECARIKKHNDRHGTRVPFPDFDSWMCAGCPVGQPLPVPRDEPQLSPGETHNVPREKHSKGQGEGQGQGELTSKAEDSGGIAVPDREDGPPVAPLPTRVEPPPSNNPAIAMSVALRKLGVNATFTHPAVQAWTESEVPHEVLVAAVAKARDTKGPTASIPPNYLVGIVSEIMNPPPMAEAKPARAAGDDWAWKKSDAGIEKKGREVGLFARSGETYRDYASRIESAIEKRKGAAP